MNEMYADTEYYKNNFYGEKTITDEKEIKKYLILASRKIDKVTFNRIVGNFDKLTEFQKKCIQDAVCWQANYCFSNGVDNSGAVSSYSVLDISVTVDKSNSKATKSNMSENALDLVSQTGLNTRNFRW
ncbi:MAG: hypothetical protein J6J11_01680 [Treponema sp.]|nr:hypothetical protein [Clostridia bacterium]MBP3607014.1 hypothetical protein [Treponema sp.]